MLYFHPVTCAYLLYRRSQDLVSRKLAQPPLRSLQTSVTEVAQTVLRNEYRSQEMTRGELSKRQFFPDEEAEERNEIPLILNATSIRYHLDLFPDGWKNQFLTRVSPSKKMCRSITSVHPNELEPAIQFSSAQEIFHCPLYQKVRNIPQVLALSGILTSFIPVANIHELICDYSIETPSPSAFLGWFKYVDFHADVRINFEVILTWLTVSDSHNAIRYLLGKIHNILINAQWFLNEQPLDKRPGLENALRQKIRNIIGRIDNTVQDRKGRYPPPYLFQFEEIVNELLSPKQLVETDLETLVLRSIAGLSLLEYRINLIEEIVISDLTDIKLPNKEEFQEALRRRVSDFFGLSKMPSNKNLSLPQLTLPVEVLETAVSHAVAQFHHLYKPIGYLQELCLDEGSSKDVCRLRSALHRWTNSHFDTHREILDTHEGIAFLLEEAGILIPKTT